MAREVELIKEKLDLVEFLRSYLTLLPAGRNFKALCPFHQEKTPSFIVSPERKIWHCFGCSEGGDLIKFVMKYENLEFPEALRFLAEKAGLEIQTMSPREQKEFGVLYDIHEKAKDFFRKELLKANAAREYLKQRKLEETTLDEFELGYAPGGETLTLHLLKSGYDINDVVRAGLAHKSLSGLYRDRFQGRIIFPITNHLGRIVAFTGRLLPGDISEMPKYLNSPETPIFKKSKILYGFHKSKNFVAEAKSVFLVEGQMDFLSAWQSGVKNAVAVSGTGLTPQHLERLRRLADSVVISFDNDEAGFKALERNLDIFNSFDFHVKVVNLGSYKDPAEACESDPAFLKQAVEWARPAMKHIFEIYFSEKAREISSISVKKRVVKHLLSMVKKIKSAVEQNIWIKELAEYSGIGENALLAELESLGPVEIFGQNTREDISSENRRSRLDLIAERLITLALAKQDEFMSLLKTKCEQLPPIYRAMIDEPFRETAGIFEMRASFEFADLPVEILKNEFSELIVHLEIESLKKEADALKAKMQEVEIKGGEAEMSEILSQFNSVATKINDLRQKLNSVKLFSVKNP